MLSILISYVPCRVGFVVSVSASRTVDVSSPPGRVIPKTIIKLPPCMARNALG